MIVTKNGVPAVADGIVVNTKWSSAPELTVNVFDVPVFPEAVAVIESVPVAVSVTDWLARTPDTNDEVVVGVMPVNKLDNVAVLVNEVAVLLLASWAVILILNAIPDV